MILGLAASCVALYYYLSWLKRVFVMEVPEGAEALQPGWGIRLTLSACVLVVLGTGCFPDWILSRFPIGK